jgi:hypothetical protein
MGCNAGTLRRYGEASSAFQRFAIETDILLAARFEQNR